MSNIWVTWGDVFNASLQNLWWGFIQFAPKLILAIIFFVVGWFLGSLIAKAFEQVFTAIREALQVRSQLLSLVQLNEQILEFDRNNPNELVLLSSKNLKAQISMNSIIWVSTQEGSGVNDELIPNLNAIGSKYRSVLDCLQAQLEILSKQ